MPEHQRSSKIDFLPKYVKKADGLVFQNSGREAKGAGVRELTCWLSRLAEQQIAQSLEHNLRQRIVTDVYWKNVARQQQLPQLARHDLARRSYREPSQSPRYNLVEQVYDVINLTICMLFLFINILPSINFIANI